MTAAAERTSAPARPAWYASTSKYGRPDLRRAVWQLVNTFVPYIALWYLMYRTIRHGYPYWVTLLLGLVAAGLQIRIFIFFHDCGHGSFFASRRANRILGYICGVLTLTPYESWRHAHALHHATVGDLERRGTGDVWTLTVREYRAAPWWTRTAYRVFRHPLVTFLIGPSLIFLFVQRIPDRRSRRQDRLSIYIIDLAILVLLAIAYWTIGLGTLSMIYLPMVVLSASAGVWLFYVQHQFEDVYWARHDVWDPMRAALEGSSHYRLPKVLQWFTGNIGFHHVHHVRARIPNYRLQECYEQIPELCAHKSLGVMESFRCMWLNLWDEDREKLVSFRALYSQPQDI